MWPYVCGVGVLLLLFFIYSLCKIASNADAAMEKALEEMQRSNE